ncbi:MAG: hypothetical protein AAFN07_16175 [Pseudomonadota bacterium]
MKGSTSASSFAYGYSILLFVVVFLGFGARAVFLPELWPPVRVSLFMHIVAMTGWFALAVYQPMLIRRQNVVSHRRVGQAGLYVAVMVIATGVTMIIELNLREFSWIQLISNSINLVTFALFFSAAMIWRTNQVVHQRMILFSSLSLMTPALARLFQPFGAEVLTMPTWLAMLATIAVFDIVTYRRVTRSTWFGLGVSVFFAACLVVAMVLFVPNMGPE